jgi:hypothetical protein
MQKYRTVLYRLLEYDISRLHTAFFEKRDKRPRPEFQRWLNIMEHPSLNRGAEVTRAADQALPKSK